MAEDTRKAVDALAETALGSSPTHSTSDAKTVETTDPVGATVMLTPGIAARAFDPTSTEALLAESDSLAATSMDPASIPPPADARSGHLGSGRIAGARVSGSGSRPGRSEPGVTSDRHPSLLEAPSPDAIPGARPDAQTLTPFGPFSRVELLAEQGAMGLVARGYNEAFDRWELLKFLRPELASEAELLRQFQREGRVLARLSHPNVVQVFATYQVDGQPCLAMEFLAGESLGALVEKSPSGIPIAQWYELFVEAARGMAAAHEVGLLHRDIKPDNLFVVPERKGGARGLKLIDFGLATADRAKIDLQSSDRSLLAQTRGGTPLYMAPELWRGEDATPRTDVFALGMTFYNAATGGFPFQVSTMPMVVLTMSSAEPFPTVREARRDLPPAYASVVDRALSKRKEDRYATADELVAALVAAGTAARPRRVPGSGPYRGLERFSASERDVFFGRDEEIAEVLERLRNQPGVLLVGPSGAGKSSLAHAGVVPSVEEGALGGGLVFRSTAIEPRTHPCVSLAAGLAHGAGVPEKDLLAFLRSTPEKTGEALRQALPPATGLVLVVDQLEELATIAVDARETHDFCVAIASIFEVLSPQLRVLGTVRADLMDRLFPIEPLRAFLTRGFYPVRPMGEAALRRALEEPAKAAGFTLEDPRVAEAIVADVSRTSAGLPLMSFAMASWWKARDEARKVLPTAAWQALGGLGGALAKHGDSVLDSMSADERASAAVILPRLISPEGTRARASRAALIDPAAAGPGAHRALDLMLQSKLVLESGGEVELAHEALITRWPRLRTMLDVAGDDRAFRERVASAARDWDMQGRPDGALWTDAQAARLLAWFTKTQAALGQQELAFIDAVRRAGAWRKLLIRSLVASGLLIATTLALLASRSERKLASSLEEARRSSVDTEKKFRVAESERLRMNAQLLLRHDPAAALRTVLKGHLLLADPSTDPIAWEARALGVATPLPLHPGGAGATRFSASSAWIATSGVDGTVHVLSANNSEHALLRPGKNGSIPRAIAFAPDSDKLATGGTGGELVLAEAPRFAPVALTTLDGGVQALAWLRPGVLLVRYATTPTPSAKSESIVATYDVSARKLTQLFKGVIAAWTRPHDLPNVLIVSADGVLHHIDTVSSKSVETKLDSVLGSAATSLGDVTAIAMSQDASTIVLGDARGTLLTASLRDGKPGVARALAAHEGAIEVLAFGPGGVLLSVATRGPARLWEATLDHPVSLDDALPAMTWIPSRNALALAGTTGELLLVSLTSRTIVTRLSGPTATATSLAASKDGDWLVSASIDGATRAYAIDEVFPRVMRIASDARPATTGRTAASPQPTPPRTVASAASPPASSSAMPTVLDTPACVVSVDGTTAACVDGNNVRVEPIEGSSVRDLKSHQVAISTRPTVLAVSPKGAHVAWCSEASAAVVDGSPVGPSLNNPLITFSSTKGHLAIAGMSNGTPQLLVMLSGTTSVQALPAPTSRPVALAFAHDDASLFVATEDGAITEVELSSKESHPALRSTLLGKAPIVGMSAADDGSAVAIADASGRVIVLPVIAGAKAKERQIASFAPPLSCLTFTQGARALVLAGRTQPLSVHDLDSPGHFDAIDPVAPIVSCARSPIDDRISFVTSERTVWLRSLDLSPATISRPPEDVLDPRTMPVELWAGLPKRAQ